jgi:CTD kinase subunit beta
LIPHFLIDLPTVLVQDAATASLFHACKVADTLKKSKEILCAGHNLKVQASERLAPDDPVSGNSFSSASLTRFQSFESPSRTMTGIERMILEAVGFDFRNRCPQPMVIKLAKFYGVSKATGFCAWYVCNDLYRTFAPLKQTTSTMAFASLELATRIEDEHCEELQDGADYKRLGSSRDCVMGKSSLSVSDSSNPSQRQSSIYSTSIPTIAPPPLWVSVMPSKPSSIFALP